MRRRSLIAIVVASLALASIVSAAMIITYYLYMTPTVVKSPVEFENGADAVSTIDNVNKTRATIQAKIVPLAKWVSEDALRIHNVNATQIQVRLSSKSVADPYSVIKSLKIYLIVDATEYLAIEIGENGAVVKGQSDWYTMAIDTMFRVKIITEGRDAILEGTQATTTLELEVRPA